MSKQQEITKNDQAAFKKNQTKLLDENIIMEKKINAQSSWNTDLKKLLRMEQREDKKEEDGGGGGVVKRDSVRSSTIYLMWVVEE